MNSSTPNDSPGRGRSIWGGALMAAVVAFLLGAFLATAWFEYGAALLSGRQAELPADVFEPLRQLQAPVQIRFYSVLPAGNASPALQEFSRRVEHLLSEFQNANTAKIKIVPLISPAPTNAAAAAAEGLQAFNLNKGEGCFLGLSIVSGTRKETLPRLDPAWEDALPFDLTRAILSVTASGAPVAAPTTVALTPSITNEILRLIPDVRSTSVGDADRIFHGEFMRQCGVVGAEMESQINAAAQAVIRAQNGGSPAELEAARKHLAEVQMQQTEKLREIAAHLQLQLAAFQEMKAAATHSR